MTVARALSPKLAVEHVVEGDLACLRFAGTIDEQFAGAVTGGAIAAGTAALVLDLGGVRKISSFGIREWVDFMAAARARAGAIVLVECAPKVVDQLNMVANFASGARVHSVYAPFRCDFCDSEHRVLLQADRDADAIQAMALPERPCPTCKHAMYFDDDGATFFSFLVAQPRAALPPAVAAFLAARLDYALADGTRKVRVDKVIDGRATYLRLAGDLDRAFPATKLAEGLEGEVIVDVAAIARIDPAGAAAWRGFVQLVTPQLERLWIAGASAAFRDTLATPGDLGARGALIEVADAGVVARLAALRARATAAHRPSSGAIPVLTPAPPPPPPLPAPALRGALWAPLIAVLITLAIAGGGVVIYLGATATGGGPAAMGLGPVEATSANARPAWATDAPGCAPAPGGGLACVGVSAPTPRQDDAEDEAADVAADELAVRIADADATRGSKLAAFARDPGSTVARREVREGRRASALLLHATAGGAAPAAPTARYWERHAGGADGTRYVAYAQLVLAPADVARLTASYAHPEAALGATAVTVAPPAGWRYPHLEHGAQITAVAPGPLQDAGLAAGEIVTAVDGREITDAPAFARLVADEQAAAVAHGGTLRLRIVGPDGAPHELVRVYEAPAAPAAPAAPRPTGAPPAVPTGGINVWDRYNQ